MQVCFVANMLYFIKLERRNIMEQTINLNDLIKSLCQQMKDITIENGYLLWVNHIKAVVREQTVLRYEKDFRQIRIFLEKKNIKMLSQVNNNVIDEFISFKRLTCKNVTINQQIQVFGFMIHYLIKEKYINFNPLENYKPLINERYQTKAQSEDTIHKALDYIDQMDEKNLTSLRNKVILLLMYDTGLRNNEIANIKKTDLDLINNMIHLSYTKAHENRIIMISDKTKKSLVNLITRLSSKTVFILNLQNPLKPLNTRVIIRAYQELSHSIEAHINNRNIRTTFATNLVQNGADIKSVMDLMGHNNMRTTQKYFDNEKSRVKRIHQELTLVK